MYYVVGSQQDLHLKQLFKILELLGFEWVDRCKHINFGMVKGMSTRKGTAIFLDDILEQTKESMHEVMRKNETKYVQIEEPDRVADIVGISAVMIQDMAAKRYARRIYSDSYVLELYLQINHAGFRQGYAITILTGIEYFRSKVSYYGYHYQYLILLSAFTRPLV
jgi:arginyl-tRNA synthetase